MISDAEIQRLAELYEASVDTLDPLNPEMEQRRKAFDLEVKRLFDSVATEGSTLPKFRIQVAQWCFKYLHRDLSPDERRARETTI
jgi:hypothetical protein